MARIREAERLAQAWLDEHVSPEIQRKLGRSAILSGLTHQFLLTGPPSEELANQVRAQVLAQKSPDEDTYLIGEFA